MNTKGKPLDLDPEVDGVAYTDDDREPEVNPDFSQRVVVETARLDWQPSPEPGVERKRLELIGEENPRLTTLVRFAPGSRFERHGHDGIATAVACFTSRLAISRHSRTSHDLPPTRRAPLSCPRNRAGTEAASEELELTD